jgi:hypothetical protein
MSDDADRADQRITDTVSDGIQASRRALGNSLAAIGVCHFCESPIKTGRVFCSTECHADWEHERQRRKDIGL